MKNYYFSTDACQQEVEAENLDEACAEFAADEAPLKGCKNAQGLTARIEKIGGTLFVTEDETPVINIK